MCSRLDWPWAPSSFLALVSWDCSVESHACLVTLHFEIVLLTESCKKSELPVLVRVSL